MTRAREALPPSRLLPRRRVVLGLLAVLAVVAFLRLDLSFGQLVPGRGGLELARSFLARALRPAVDYEGIGLPAETPPFAVTVGTAVLRTLQFAAAGMALALAVGLPLGCLCSSRAWKIAGDRRVPLGLVAARGIAALLRSVHELLWAVLLLAAFGLVPSLAVLAIALTYAGTLAKVFGELLDEEPGEREHALVVLGARPSVAFLVGRLAPASPVLLSYAFYRFECAVRSAAVLGFLGIETLGLRIDLAFENRHFGEVWTYLYALLTVIVALELWSSHLRRRFVA